MKRFIILFALISILLMSLPVQANSYRIRVAVINDPDGYTNVRKGPGTEYKVISKIYENEHFLFLQCAYKDWWLVQSPDGKIGYMNADRIVFLEPLLPAKYYAYINDPDGYTNIRKGPGKGYKVTGKVYKDEIFIVLQNGEHGEWEYILTKNGIYGYMHSSRILPVPIKSLSEK
ncbi:MAG: SH3 domain-containing protein [Candidatus Eremiobacterota bacterium]